jgi:hypothetical protein
MLIDMKMNGSLPLLIFLLKRRLEYRNMFVVVVMLLRGRSTSASTASQSSISSSSSAAQALPRHQRCNYHNREGSGKTDSITLRKLLDIYRTA